MRIMGIDYGSKRIGIALTDESREFAIPREVIPNDKMAFDKIKNIISDSGVDLVVVGESLNFEGQENPIMVGIHRLKKMIAEDIGVDVIFEPEFLTSAEAEQIQGKNIMVDASAAAIILRSFIQRKK